MKRAAHLFFLVLIWTLPLSAQQLRIYHIDVEQASATLFVAPGGKTLLVDSGKNGMGSRIKAVMDRAHVNSIDYFVDTHYHEDHYGGIDDLIGMGVPVIEAYDRGDKELLLSDKLSEVSYQNYQDAVGFRAHHLTAGMTLPLDPLMTITCISSDGLVIGESPAAVSNDENNLSISLLITMGSFRYFIGGDIQSPTEQKIADRELVKDVDVYIADHHGSDTSSIVPFLSDMNPHVVIISNGDNASFHHPRQITLTSISQLPGPPVVFQTNKCTKGPPCGNVPDGFIGDPQSSDQDGTIALTADIAAASYSVALDSGAKWTFSFRNSQPVLTVSTIGSGNGAIASNPAGISCGETCNVPFTSGQSVTLVATPAAGSVFGGWNGDEDCRDGSVMMNALRTCLARFDLPVSDSTLLGGDYDGDGKTDIAVFRPSTSEWFLRLSSLAYAPAAGNWYFQWGVLGDVPVVGNFDGDGKTDIAVFRPSTAEWFIRLSSQNYLPAAGNWHFQWGAPGDVPITSDFDGDGKTDIAVYRPPTGEWFLRLSSQNYAPAVGNWYFQWGGPGDQPIPGDYDGDGRTDFAVFRPSTGEWFIKYSGQGYVPGAGNWYFQWGLPGDTPIASDFDGDGKVDIAVYRQSAGEWFLRLSSQNYIPAVGNWYYQWGLPGDLPIRGDFDGDHKNDFAVYRPSAEEWFLRLSTQHYVAAKGNWYFQWGGPGDIPLRR